MRRLTIAGRNYCSSFHFQARLTSPSYTDTERPIELRTAVVNIHTDANSWFAIQIDYDVLELASISQACADAIDEVGKEALAAKLEREAQQHTIFQRVPTWHLQEAVKRPTSELSGKAREQVEDASKLSEIRDISLSIAFGRQSGLNLPTHVGKLLCWFKEHTPSAELKAELTVPPLESDLVLNDRDLPGAFTVLWNLWHNASSPYGDYGKKKATSFCVRAGWDDRKFLVALKPRAVGQDWISYLQQVEAEVARE